MRDVKLFEDHLVWFKQGDKNSSPYFAVPVEKSNGVLTLLVFRKNGTGYSTQPGVRHVDDPAMSNFELRLNSGGWEFASDYNARMELESEERRRANAAVEKAVAKKKPLEPASA